jgi:PAS domain S-box-containing protein
VRVSVELREVVVLDSSAIVKNGDAKLRTMFNLAPVAIAILDGRFHYESVNPAYCALTGYLAEELVGQSGGRFLGKDADQIDADSNLELSAGKRWTRQVAFTKKDGSVVTLEWRIAKESISGARILVATDITQTLREDAARESLLASERTARTEAERSNRINQEFLATLSHELRNPLNAILGWATVLSRKPDLPEAVVHGLQAIERNSRLQAQMISDLLDHASISVGKLRLTTETIDPYPPIRAAVEVINGSAQVAGVRVHATFGEESLRIDADAARLQQIVWNLLSNAVKFSARGGEVSLEVGRNGECLEMIVTDHGTGIELDFLPRIFERFSQQDATTKRSHGGLGLGLAIARQLAELHGGSIHAFSSGKGTGARFTVTIPLTHNDPAR